MGSGSSGDPTTENTYIAMGWALMGSPKLANAKYPNLRSFAKFEKAVVNEEYRLDLENIAIDYAEVVAKAFNRAHGRSGETADTIDWKYKTQVSNEVGVLDTQTIAVQLGGHIGFVVNPLPDHPITGKFKYLSNQNTLAMEYAGYRSMNFHGDFPLFGAFVQVDWFQEGPGGDNSFSPDRTWFEEGEARDLLEVQAVAKLAGLAQYAQVLWAKDYNGFVVLDKGGDETLLPLGA